MDSLVPLNLTSEQKIELLNKCAWIKKLSVAQIAELASFLMPFEAANGSVIIHEGKKINHFGFICEGEVFISKATTGGSGKMIYHFTVGSVLGIISFFDEGLTSASVVVQQHATILLMNRKAYETFCREAPATALQVASYLVRYLAHNLRETTACWFDASSNS
jgi:CRP-like cAMP-binding protein